MNVAGSGLSTSILGVTGGGRLLQQSVAIEADPDEVWEAWATGEGQMRWAAPFVHVELAVDGHIEAGFSTAARLGDPAHIRHRILAFIPGRMLAWQTTAVPPGAAFDPALWLGTHQVAEMTADSTGLTRMTQPMVGIGGGTEWDPVLAFAREVNAWGLRNLKQALEAGPIDWSAQSLPRSGRPTNGGKT